jgi:hypothetical protein
MHFPSEEVHTNTPQGGISALVLKITIKFQKVLFSFLFFIAIFNNKALKVYQRKISSSLFQQEIV